MSRFATSAASAFGFGVVGIPRTPEGRAGFAELCTYLSEQTGAVIFPYHAIHYHDLADALARGRIGLAWVPPLLAVDLSERGVAQVLALPVRHGSTAYLTALVVQRGRGWSLADLEGKRAAWVDRESASGYVAARLYLRSVGLDVERLFAEEIFLHSHELVIDAVAGGRADVGATYCSSDPRPLLRHPLPDARGSMSVEVLATAGPIPNDGIAIHESVSATLRHRVLDALIDAQGGSAAELFRRLLHADGFCAALPSHYSALRRMLAAGGAWSASLPTPPHAKRKSNAPAK